MTLTPELINIIASAVTGVLAGVLSGFFMNFLNRKQIRAGVAKQMKETEELDEKTRQLRVKTQNDQQTQIAELVKQVDGLIDRARLKDEQHDKERDAKRDELNRIYQDYQAVRNELRAVSMTNSSLVNQLHEVRTANIKANELIAERDRRIEELQQLGEQHTEKIRRLSNELTLIKKRTGQLPARDQL